MSVFSPASRSRLTTAGKVALAYVIVASLWITCSDLLLAQLASDPLQLSHLQTAKGWLFVAVTGSLLFLYLRRCLHREQATFNELTTLFDSIPSIVYVADMQTHELLFVNRFAAERFGQGWGRMRCFDYLQEGQQELCSFCTNPLLLQDGQPGPPVTWEIRNTRDGRWYQCLDKAIYWPDGRLVRVEIAVDITERKEMERTKEELLAAVSHDMRTPLTAIAGFTELLLNDPSLSDPVRRHLETVYSEAGKMQDLVQTFLEVRRLKSDGARLDYESLPVQSLLRKAADSSRECTDRHPLTIDCPAGLAVVGNRRELTQVFKQLIDNACRFSPQGGEIVLQASDKGAYARVAVIDHGIGMPREDLERIFEPFHRLDIGDRRKVRGIGLGLTMVREIVSIHGGNIQVESAPGQGSRFIVTLPKPGTGQPAPPAGQGG